MYHHANLSMPTKQKPKVTLAQRLAGLQQIILAELNATQKQLLDAINRSDFDAMQSSMEHVQRALKMRQLAQQLLELAREGKAKPSNVSSPDALAPATHTQQQKPAKHSSPAKKAAPTKKAPTRKNGATSTSTSSKPSQQVERSAQPAEKHTPTVTEQESVEEGSSVVAAPATSSKRRGPMQTGIRTPEREFILPILQSLIDKGGEAPASEVVEDVKERMKHILKPTDFQTTETTDQPRWKVSLYLARSEMIRKGLLRSDSPRGVWAISDAGRQYAQHMQSSN
jgi:hypothetical protein